MQIGDPLLILNRFISTLVKTLLRELLLQQIVLLTEVYWWLSFSQIAQLRNLLNSSLGIVSEIHYFLWLLRIFGVVAVDMHVIVLFLHFTVHLLASIASKTLHIENTSSLLHF